MNHYSLFLDSQNADMLFGYLLNNIDWKIFTPSPNSRKVCHKFVDNDPILENCINKIQDKFGIKLQKQIFLNLYQDGNDYCPYHRDNYGYNTYTLSLGCPRDFCIKMIKQKL